MGKWYIYLKRFFNDLDICMPQFKEREKLIVDLLVINFPHNQCKRILFKNLYAFKLFICAH